MHCINCGQPLADGQLICPNCGTKVVQQAAQEVPHAAPAPQQTYNQTVYVQSAPQKVYVQQTRSNGPANAGLVFGIITLVLLIINLICESAISNSLSHNNADSAVGVTVIVVILAILVSIMMFLDIIFSIIGFIRGLKTTAGRGKGIAAFFLMIINIILIIIETVWLIELMDKLN